MEEPIRDDPAVLELLYQPLVLEDAMNRVMRGHRDGAGESLGIPTDSMLASFEAHKCFTNKLAQILDKERGGRTVTALTILQSNRRPIYVIASNLRTKEELGEAQTFLKRLLGFVHDNPLELNPKPLFKKVLGRIILFNLPRIQAYLINLRRYLGTCIDDCGKREETQSILELEHELKTLQNKASFPMELGTDNEKDKSWKHGKNCVTTSGRLLSYRQAAEVIIAANERWPQLFQGFHVVAIPCSEKARNPMIHRELSAAAIVRGMLWDDEDPEPYLEQVAKLSGIGLDDEVKGQVKKKKFKPFVHAEVQVHAALIRDDYSRSSQFWSRYKYIGSSKPTCRLCAYYFFERGDGMQVRPTHQNLYLHWRLPDLLERITEHVRKDAKRTLDERMPSRRRHDSNDRSSIPSLLRPGDLLDAGSTVSDLASETSRLYVDSSTNGSIVPPLFNRESLSRLMEEEAEDFDSSDEEGEDGFESGSEEEEVDLESDPEEGEHQ
ncbi:uncharacterized protein PG998_002698 [Apiospora kogelbergensis]|uniref:uncharacterized protein n=1 Tax=Apiospora kogelbergensis TaxID=1337665 RepID=UPI00312F0C2C